MHATAPAYFKCKSRLQKLHAFRYTGHCPTLKFRVGKRFGASTEEIMKVKMSYKTKASKLKTKIVTSNYKTKTYLLLENIIFIIVIRKLKKKIA